MGVALTLREQYIGGKFGYTAAKNRSATGVLVAWMVKAWNAHVRGEGVTFLRVRLVGESPEPFPRLVLTKKQW